MAILSNGICICLYNGNESDKYYGFYVGVGHKDKLPRVNTWVLACCQVEEQREDIIIYTIGKDLDINAIINKLIEKYNNV